jgi:ABC-type uncharacterized transport system substrate-binding protein
MNCERFCCAKLSTRAFAAANPLGRAARFTKTVKVGASPRTQAWRSSIIRFLQSLLIAVWPSSITTLAEAHPHVWVTMRTELVYAPDGSVTAVQHAWTFDDMFSAFATQGIPARTKGQFTRAELQPLAQVNIESLTEYAYFTYVKIDGRAEKNAFSNPTDYWLDYDPQAAVLTLHFRLPFKKPVKTRRLTVEIYDPEFFIDFGFADKNPVTLLGAPRQCTFSDEKPNDGFFSSTLKLDKSFMTSEANIGMGMNFANKISVTCP